MSTTITRFIQIKENNSWKTINTLSSGGWLLREIFDDEEIMNYRLKPEDNIEEDDWYSYAVLTRDELRALSNKYAENAVRIAIDKAKDSKLDEILAILKKTEKPEADYYEESVREAIDNANVMNQEDYLASILVSNYGDDYISEWRVVYQIG